MELNEMKKKWEILSQQVEKLKSVNQEMLNKSVSGRVSKIIAVNSAGVIILPLFIVIISIFPLPFAQWVGVSLIAALSFFSIWTLINLLLLLKSKSYKNTLCETERYFLIFKKSETINYCVQYLFMLPWSFIFIYQYIQLTNITQTKIIILLLLLIIASWGVSLLLTKVYFKRIKEVQKEFKDLKSFMEDE